MRLSRRLNAIAELIPAASVICDVGTDHAYLPCRLILDGKCERAIATDISKNCIARAEETARACCVLDKIKFVHCSGVSGVEVSEFDVLVAAGMGGETIIEILEAGKAKLFGKTLILSAHTKQTELLAWLLENGFVISKEELVRDRGKTYLIQMAISGSDYQEQSVDEINT